MRKQVAQKEVFVRSEGDAWHDRNNEAVGKHDFARDPVACAIVNLCESGTRLKILEIGCGAGHRLAWLAERIGAEVYGIEPSVKAVGKAQHLGVAAIHGTADELPYGSGSFDVVVFGFCLYLCDTQDLFQIAKEADRVLKAEGWLIIHDFFAESPLVRDYSHMPGILCHKMDYRRLFEWHPAYTCFSQQISHHATNAFTDDPQEWVATSVLRKSSTVKE